MNQKFFVIVERRQLFFDCCVARDVLFFLNISVPTDRASGHFILEKFGVKNIFLIKLHSIKNNVRKMGSFEYEFGSLFSSDICK